KTTMAHALELRVPLLDHLLVEEIAGWPDEWKIDGSVGKAILRTAARGLVSEQVLSRPKMGFATPAAAWLRGALGGLAEDVLFSPRSLSVELGSTMATRRLLEEHSSRTCDRSPELWALLCLEIWRQKVLDGVASG
ncbi:MAG: asparagine synthase-related protein, partial [Pseudomonadota bacterium]